MRWGQAQLTILSFLASSACPVINPRQPLIQIWKAGGSWMSNITFLCVNPIQLVPTTQKKLFTSPYQAKFLKISFTKAAGTSIKSYVPADFFVPQSQVVLGASTLLYPVSVKQGTEW